MLQFWRGDQREAMELARLLADIEPEYRGDVALVLARESTLKLTPELAEIGSYCAQKFPTRHLQAKVQKGVKYPEAVNQAWASAMQQLSDSFFSGEAPHRSLFLIEPDGCPLTKDWIDRLKNAHNETLLSGYWVTGPRSWDGFRLHHHINGTCVMDCDFWENHPSLHRTPPGTGWDGFHGRVMLAATAWTKTAR